MNRENNQKNAVRYVIRVYGVVQGVSYRAWVRKQAQELGVVGYVENESDGTVEIDAQGEEQQLEQLIDRCQNGSSLSEVERIDVEKNLPLERYTDFSIHY